MRVMRKENQALKQKILGSRENENMKSREHNAEEVDANEINRKRCQEDNKVDKKKYQEVLNNSFISTTKRVLNH